MGYFKKLTFVFFSLYIKGGICEKSFRKEEENCIRF